MFEQSLINQIRNGGAINNEVIEAEVALPEDTNFNVDDVQCTIGFKESTKKVGKYFVVLTAQINGATITNRYSTRNPNEEEIENAKQILTKSVNAIKRILNYNVNIDQDEDDKINIKFDWETYSAFKQECSFGDFLPEVPEVNEEETNEEETSDDTNKDLSCVLNLKNADSLEEYADLLDETWKETIEKFCDKKLFVFTVVIGKEEISYISATNIQQDGTFIYFEGNISSDDYARKIDDVKAIKKSEIPSYETDMLKKVILA